MPLELDAAARKRIANRLMVQAPKSDAERQEFTRFMREVDRVADLPADVLIRLEVIAQLAEQGNGFAKALYMEEAKRFGITFPRHY